MRSFILLIFFKITIPYSSIFSINFTCIIITFYYCSKKKNNIITINISIKKLKICMIHIIITCDTFVVLVNKLPIDTKKAPIKTFFHFIYYSNSSCNHYIKLFSLIFYTFYSFFYIISYLFFSLYKQLVSNWYHSMISIKKSPSHLINSSINEFFKG